MKNKLVVCEREREGGERETETERTAEREKFLSLKKVHRRTWHHGGEEVKVSCDVFSFLSPTSISLKTMVRWKVVHGN